VEAEVVSPYPSPAPGPARRASGGGAERIVALALAVMAAVLGVVYIDLARAEPKDLHPPFDFVNPLLSVQTGECVEISSPSEPEFSSWLVVRSPGKVLRPHRGETKVPGWSSPRYPDPKSYPPFLVCDARPAPVVRRSAEGLPPRKDEPYLFPLNGFGLPVEALGVLRDIGQTEVTWGGQKRRAYVVGLMRYGQVEGPWLIYMAQGVPVLGTMSRKYFRGLEAELQSFRVPDTCR